MSSSFPSSSCAEEQETTTTTIAEHPDKDIVVGNNENETNEQHHHDGTTMTCPPLSLTQQQSSIQTVFITGGNRGLGRALVELFATQPGWNVICTARHVDTLPRGNNILGLELDLTHRSHMMGLIAPLRHYFQKPNHSTQLNVIIHNAAFHPKDKQQQDHHHHQDNPRRSSRGAGGAGYFESTFYIQDFDSTNVMEPMLINAIHPMELTGQILLPHLSKQNGLVLCISSWLASITQKDLPGHYGYAGSKTLLNMFTKAMALEFSKDYLEVAPPTNQQQSQQQQFGRAAVAINPGWMQTDMGRGRQSATNNNNSGNANAAAASIHPEYTPQQVAKRIFTMIQDGTFRANNGKFLNIMERTEMPW